MEGGPVSGDEELVGTVVAGRYRIERKLGEGGMGAVYKAVHEALRKPVALKLLSGRGSSDRETVARFEREAVAAANLRHPNIAEATDFGRLPDGAFYLVMEYIEGRTLRALVDASPSGVPPARALPILRQVAAALACAHAADIVHRDLKPENVLVIDRPDSKDVVKVIDFGIARIRSAAFGGGGAQLTAAGAVFGTPEYMAPEQVMGQPADPRADQYAFGVTAYELLTGHVPYTGGDVSQILMKHITAPIPTAGDTAPHLPPAVSGVLRRLLAKRPEERFATIDAAVQALEAAFSSPAAGTVRMEGPVPRPPAAAGATVSLRGAGAPHVPQAMTGPQASSSAPAGPAAPAMTGPPGPYSPPATPAVPSVTAPPVPYSAGELYAAPPPGAAVQAQVALPPVAAAPGQAPPPQAPVPTAKGPLQSLKAVLDDPGKNPVLAFAVLGGGGVLFLIVSALVIWRLSSSSLPGPLGDAIDRWEDGAYEEAEPALKDGLSKTPALAADPALYRPLVAAVHDDKARTVLLQVLNTTQLGRSAPMAAELAEIGLDEDASAARNGALRLLRGRLDLLPGEVRARIALRDADDCAALDKAVGELAAAGSAAEADAKRFREGQCKQLLRREELCGCPPKGPPKSRGNKGRGL
jgi:hypothetical protein